MGRAVGRTDGRTDGRWGSLRSLRIGRTDGRRSVGRTVGRTDGQSDGRTAGLVSLALDRTDGQTVQRNEQTKRNKTNKRNATKQISQTRRPGDRPDKIKPNSSATNVRRRWSRKTRSGAVSARPDRTAGPAKRVQEQFLNNIRVRKTHGPRSLVPRFYTAAPWRRVTDGLADEKYQLC